MTESRGPKKLRWLVVPKGLESIKSAPCRLLAVLPNPFYRASYQFFTVTWVTAARSPAVNSLNSKLTPISLKMWQLIQSWPSKSGWAATYETKMSTRYWCLTTQRKSFRAQDSAYVTFKNNTCGILQYVMLKMAEYTVDLSVTGSLSFGGGGLENKTHDGRMFWSWTWTFDLVTSGLVCCCETLSRFWKGMAVQMS